MTKFGLRQAFGAGKARASVWVLMLALLMLSIVVTGAAAQDDKGADDVDIVFVEDEFSVTEANAKADAGEVYITVTKDSYIASNDPNRNFGFDQLVRFGFSPSGLGATRPIFKFKVEDFVPSTANITYAELRVYLTNINDSDTSRGYAAHNVTEAWDEGNVTWNNSPSYGPEIGRGTLGNTPGWQVTEVTNQAKDWLKNPQNNKGVILVGDERPDQNFERDYFSKQSTTGLVPQLYVQFDTSSDNVPPVAEVVQPSEGAWSPADFVVAWEGFDPPNSDGSPGSGIRWYDVFYTTNEGNNWIVGRAQVTTTQTNVSGAQHLAKIGFYARAMDNAGNQGPNPSGSGSIQTWTRIDAQPPEVTVNPLPELTPSSSWTVSWHDTSEHDESGIRYYDVQFRENNGDWQQFVYHTTATSAIFNKGRNGITYEFRARGVDNVGNTQDWEGPQAVTTVWLEPVASIIPFPAPPIYQKLNGPQAGDGFTVSWEGTAPPGATITSFDVRYQRPGNPTWIVWLSGTADVSAKFNLALNDPDGIYIFQVRARDDQGIQGNYQTDGQAEIIVDRLAPFMTHLSQMPIVAAED
jgi:TGF-beta propeptide